MRVVVKHPARTVPAEEQVFHSRDPETGVISVTTKVVREAEQVPESISIYRLARIDDFVNPMTGETTPKAVVAQSFLEQAQAEFPDCEVELQYRSEDGEKDTPEHQIIWSTEPSAGESAPSAAHAQALHVGQGSGVVPGEAQ